jgi:hypothetical protein
MLLPSNAASSEMEASCLIKALVIPPSHHLSSSPPIDRQHGVTNQQHRPRHRDLTSARLRIFQELPEERHRTQRYPHDFHRPETPLRASSQICQKSPSTVTIFFKPRLPDFGTLLLRIPSIDLPSIGPPYHLGLGVVPHTIESDPGPQKHRYWDPHHASTASRSGV